MMTYYSKSRLTSENVSIVTDEVTDESRLHHLELFIRWDLELGLLLKGDAETVFSVIENMLIRVQLPINHCRGHGASVMSVCASGRVLILKEEPFLFTV
jgi:hypothetical protein